MDEKQVKNSYDSNRFTDIEGGVMTKKDGSKWEFRNGQMVCIKPPKNMIMEKKTKHQLGKEHTAEKPHLLCGHEEFKQGDKSLGFNVMDYWRFQYSNLIDNLGCVAEFLVARALKKAEPDNCNGWTLYDLSYRDIRIEVKATSYWQSWKKSQIISEQRVFSIRGSHIEYQNTNTAIERQNDIYIFCVDEGRDAISANPLNVDNWTFYIVPTTVINKEYGDKKTLSLKTLQKLNGYNEGLKWNKIKVTVDTIIDQQMMKCYTYDTEELRIFRDGIEMHWDKQQERFLPID